MEAFTLDKATILDRLGGDEEIFCVMADMFLHDVGNYCNELAAALVAGNAAHPRDVTDHHRVGDATEQRRKVGVGKAVVERAIGHARQRRAE